MKRITINLLLISLTIFLSGCFWAAYEAADVAAGTALSALNENVLMDNLEIKEERIVKDSVGVVTIKGLLHFDTGALGTDAKYVSLHNLTYNYELKGSNGNTIKNIKVGFIEFPNSKFSVKAVPVDTNLAYQQTISVDSVIWEEIKSVEYSGG